MRYPARLSDTVPLLDTHINPDCKVGNAIQFSLGDAYEDIQRVAEEEMARISLQKIIGGYCAHGRGRIS